MTLYSHYWHCTKRSLDVYSLLITSYDKQWNSIFEETDFQLNGYCCFRKVTSWHGNVSSINDRFSPFTGWKRSFQHICWYLEALRWGLILQSLSSLIASSTALLLSFLFNFKTIYRLLHPNVIVSRSRQMNRFPGPWFAVDIRTIMWLLRLHPAANVSVLDSLIATQTIPIEGWSPVMTSLDTCNRGYRKLLNSFTVSLHSPDGRHLAAVRVVQGDCQSPLTNWENCNRLMRKPRILCDRGIPQSIFRQAITKVLEAMPHIPLMVPWPPG